MSLPAWVSAASSAARVPEPRSRSRSGSARSSSSVTCLRPCQGCAALDDEDDVVGQQLAEVDAPVARAGPDHAHLGAALGHPLRHRLAAADERVIAMSGNFSLKRPISAGRMYSPGIVLAPTSSSPLMRPWKLSMACRASRESARMRCA